VLHVLSDGLHPILSTGRELVQVEGRRKTTWQQMELRGILQGTEPCKRSPALNLEILPFPSAFFPGAFRTWEQGHPFAINKHVCSHAILAERVSGVPFGRRAPCQHLCLPVPGQACAITFVHKGGESIFSESLLHSVPAQVRVQLTDLHAQGTYAPTHLMNGKWDCSAGASRRLPDFCVQQ
jgi:hypothetical protein